MLNASSMWGGMQVVIVFQDPNKSTQLFRDCVTILTISHFAKCEMNGIGAVSNLTNKFEIGIVSCWQKMQVLEYWFTNAKRLF